MTPAAIVLPECIEQSLQSAHATWQVALRTGLEAIVRTTPDYLSQLAKCHFLPTDARLFAAFALPMDSVRYILFGEGPYPRAESATGVCFMDGAVEQLWVDGVGLSKPVNRATSLRNFMKMLLVADGILDAQQTTAAALQPVSVLASKLDSGWIQTGLELQQNLMQQGFLLLNASLVFRKEIAPAIDAKAWLPFLRSVLQALATDGHPSIKLVLWGKIAEKIIELPEAAYFEALISEHPYNLSFIANPGMQALFQPFKLLKRSV